MLSTSSEADSFPLREAVVAAGLEIIDSAGLELAPGSLSYARVFAFLEDEYSVLVTRGSVHERIWASHDQFRRDVLTEAVGYLPQHVSPTIRPGDRLILDEAADESEPVDRVTVFSRLAGLRFQEAILTSHAFGIAQSVKAIASRTTDVPGANTIREAVSDRTDERLQFQRATFPGLLSRLGQRVSPDLGLGVGEASDVFQVITGAMFTALYLDHHTGSSEATRPLSTFMGTSTASDQAWVPVAVGFHALLGLLAEAGQGPPLSQPPIADPEPRPGPTVDAEITGRRSRQELRNLVIAAGVELLLRDGLELRPDSISYAAVFARVKERHGTVVNRASVHQRFWRSHEEFCLEVLAAWVRSNAELVDLDVRPGEEPADPPTGNQRRAHAVERIRTVIGADTDALGASPSFRRRLLIKASIPGKKASPGFAPLQAALLETDGVLAERIREFVQKELLSLGFRARPDLGLSEGAALDVLAIVADLVMTGLVFNRMSLGPTIEFELPRPDGTTERERWSPAAVMVRAMFELLYEEDGRSGVQ